MYSVAVVDKVEKIWLDGEFVDWDNANVHVLTHTLHYGLGVFEGIRAYDQQGGGVAVFRLEEHIRRLFDSAHICQMQMPFTQAEVVAACTETIRVNKLGACYLRPLAFLGDGAMGLGADNDTRVMVAAWRWGSYLGDEGMAKGIRAKVSSFSRPGVNSLMAKGKIVGHYVNSILAKREAKQMGYDEAILLDPAGYVSEASGENIFVIRDGVVVTPPLGASILGGITRHTVMALMAADGLEIVERRIARDELYIADEIFMVGTAAEVTPVREVDNRKVGVGARGSVTERVQSRYLSMVRGDAPLDPTWLHQV